MSAKLPPLNQLAETDRSGGIVVSAYTWASLTVATALVRFALALHRKLSLQLDDVTFAVAVVLAVGSSVCYHLAANAGLGRHESELSRPDVDSYFKTVYAAQLTGLVAIGGGKISAVFLSKRVAVVSGPTYTAMLGTMAAWTVFSFLATAFQCGLPGPWRFDPSGCPSHGDVQYPIVVLNMVTDGVMVVWILLTLWKLDIPHETKLTAMVLFSLRVLVPCVAVGQLALLPNLLQAADQTWTYATKALLDQAVIHLSVILAAVPRINRFISSATADLALSHISPFELNPHKGDPGSQQGESVRQLTHGVTPRGTSSTTAGTWEEPSRSKDERGMQKVSTGEDSDQIDFTSASRPG